MSAAHGVTDGEHDDAGHGDVDREGRGEHPPGPDHREQGDGSRGDQHSRGEYEEHGQTIAAVVGEGYRPAFWDGIGHRRALW
ncbi:MAG TPA: hypothetical protein VIK04_21130 [Solirubrobacteraceae bacterium]